MIKPILSVLTVVLLVGIVAGCTRQVRSPIYGREDPYRADQIQYVNRELARETTVGRPQITRDEAGLLHVSVPIRLTTNRDTAVDYRFRFIDANGQELSQSGWFTKHLSPNVFDEIKANSMSDRAADFQMHLRYAQ